MIDINKIKAVYFIGAGGIGMSALVRYFIHLNKFVAGYDKTPTILTDQLIFEGADLHFTDNVQAIPPEFMDKEQTLVVYTPAIPQEHQELNFFRDNGFTLMKRAQVLGLITRHSKALCVAGTHGKTTTSTMLAHLLHQSNIGCNAFLGGVAKNYDTNLLLSKESPYTVIEADEFDRSFHWLSPYMTIITAVDADHLDIYGTEEAYRESFEHYISLVQANGVVLAHHGITLHYQLQPGVKYSTYGLTEGDYHASNIRIGGGRIIFDWNAPDMVITDIDLGVPVTINIENAVAAIAIAHLNGVSEEEIKQGMSSFKGVTRRFDFKIREKEYALLSDYGHHPEEVKKSIQSVKDLYPNQKLTVIFQPHLYSRTKDFYKEFAASLSLADEVILTEIYPARELPIEGVSSQLIYDEMSEVCPKSICPKELIVSYLKEHPTEIVMLLGAGDIDNYAEEIKKVIIQTHTEK